MNGAARTRGLTLVELLVTIVLVALTVSLVIGGIGQGSALLARVSADQGEVYQELMARAWLRQTLATAATPATGQRGFEGSPEQLHLRTFRPLLGSEGIATDIVWRAAPQGGLEYVEGDQSIQVTALPALARFEYQDASLAWHGEWPVEDEETGLPERVRVVFADGGDRLDVALITQRAPFAHSDESMYDRE